MTGLAFDLRYALRHLRRRPAFTAVAMLTLALGIGATTAIFSVLHGVVLRPLDLHQPERLVTVWEDRSARGGPEREWTGLDTFTDWRDGTEAFSGLAAVSGGTFSLAGHEEVAVVSGGVVTPGYLELLGVQPVAGRSFLPEEEEPGRDGVVVLAEGLWRRAFGADPTLVGREVIVNDRPRTVVGIAPAGFRDPMQAGAEVWVPLDRPVGEPDRGNHYLRVVGRLAPGATAERAESEVAAVMRRIGAEFPLDYGRAGAAVVPLQETVVGAARTPLLAVFGAVVLVLLVACVNLAGLLLARATERRRELAVRRALGAGRPRVARQLLVESLLLALLGGGAGVALGALGSRALVRFAPADTPRLDEVGLHLPVLLFAAAATILTGLLFGLLPAWNAGRGRLAGALRQGGRGGSGTGGGRLRSGLVVAEVALSLVLLAGAGLLLRSLWALADVEAGFEPERAVVATVAFPLPRFPEIDRVAAWIDGVEEALRADPRVAAAGTVNIVPLAGTEYDVNYLAEGVAVEPGDEPAAEYRVGTPGLLQALEVPLLAGRWITDGDDAAAPPVVVINRTLARSTFGDGDPLGRRLKVGSVRDPEAPWLTVVGVIGDVRHDGLDQESEAQVYLPYRQAPTRIAQVVVRGRGDEERLAGMLRATIRGHDPAMAIRALVPARELVRGQLATPSFVAFLLLAFAAVALVLALVGIYGVVAYAVSQRRRELGVRVALGAAPRQLLGMVVLHGAGIAALGVTVGLVAALALGRFLRALLFEVAPSDPWTLSAGAALLLLAAVAATLAPARRAARTDPIEALREE